MRELSPSLFLGSLALGLAASRLPAVVISEIHYHPPAGEENLEFIEVSNDTTTPDGHLGISLPGGDRVRVSTRDDPACFRHLGCLRRCGGRESTLRHSKRPGQLYREARQLRRENHAREPLRHCPSEPALPGRWKVARRARRHRARPRPEERAPRPERA